jgi:hypothetical protein
VLSKLPAFVEMSLFVQIKKNGGELLDLNFETRYEANKTALLKEAQRFGLAFLCDGATVKRMALLNILAMCANTPHITVSIQAFTRTHMQEGGKKMHIYCQFVC